MSTIVLPPRCDRAAAEVLLPELLAASRAGTVAIEGSGVEQIGQAMIQLLLSARQGSATMLRPSSALVEAARMSGLSEQLFDEGAA